MDSDTPSTSAHPQASSASERYIQSQTGPTVPYDRHTIYNQLEAFTHNNDEFQAGLGAILAPLQSGGATPEQIQETQLRAKVFFFMSKTGTQVDFDDYLSWRSTQPSPTEASLPPEPASERTDGSVAVPPPTLTAQDPQDTIAEPYPASFDSIVELIATGQTDKIAGIRDIPLKINDQQPTKPSLARPSKPWEKTADQDQQEDDAPAAVEELHTA